MVEVNIASSRCPKLCPDHLPLITLLLNIITSINIRLPNRSEVVKKVRVITLVISWALK